jgi:hypothetical protein
MMQGKMTCSPDRTPAAFVGSNGDEGRFAKRPFRDSINGHFAFEALEHRLFAAIAGADLGRRAGGDVGFDRLGGVRLAEVASADDLVAFAAAPRTLPSWSSTDHLLCASSTGQLSAVDLAEVDRAIAAVEDFEIIVVDQAQLPARGLDQRFGGDDQFDRARIGIIAAGDRGTRSPAAR